MFTRMQDGTAADWGRIVAEHRKHQATRAPLQIMDSLRRLAPMQVGFAADQLTHSLMTATLARRDNASQEEVVAALCHDLGKLFSVPNHGPIGAEMLKPYVSDYIYHTIYWHQTLQGYWYFEHLGHDRNGRDKFRNEPWFDFAERLVDCWDAPAFDPDYDVDPLESFEADVIAVFGDVRRNPEAPKADG